MANHVDVIFREKVSVRSPARKEADFRLHPLRMSAKRDGTVRPISDEDVRHDGSKGL